MGRILVIPESEIRFVCHVLGTLDAEGYAPLMEHMQEFQFPAGDGRMRVMVSDEGAAQLTTALAMAEDRDIHRDQFDDNGNPR